jgi:hypothetical protein
MAPLLALSENYSDDPLGLFVVVSAGGFAAWVFGYNVWKLIIGLLRHST